MRRIILALAIMLTGAPAFAQEGAAKPPLTVRIQLMASKSTILAAQMAGKIVEINVKDGDSFPEGKVLMRFNCSRSQALLARARATQDKRAKIAQNTGELLKLKSVSPLEYDVARAEAAEAQAEVHLAQTEVDRCNVVAPFSGRVGDLAVKEHETVAEGRPLLEILNDTELGIEAILPSSEMSWLTPGRKFQVRIDETGQAYDAKILRVGGKVDPVSRTFKLYGQLVQRAPELKAGMSGNAVFEQ